MGDPDDNIHKLEEKIVKAVELFRRTQAEKRTLQRELESLMVDFKERTKRSETLERDLLALRRERDEVRSRIEKVLEQIDMLTKPGIG